LVPGLKEGIYFKTRKSLSPCKRCWRISGCLRGHYGFYITF